MSFTSATPSLTYADHTSGRPPHDLGLAAHPAPAIGELVPVSLATIGGEVVNSANGIDLHAYLEVGKDFSTWIKDRVTQYGFVEHRDFVTAEILSSPKSGSAKARPQRTTAYYLSLDMAKELAMVERNAKGKEARQYFIECERRALTAVPALPNFADPAAAARAWADQVEAKQALQVSNAKLEHKVAEQAPAVAGFDLIASADGSMCIRDAAATLKMRQCDLTDYLVSKGWIYERVGAEGFKAYSSHLQALDLRYSTFPYESKSTGETKVRQQVRITNKGLTKLARMIAAEKAEAELAQRAAASPQGVLDIH